MRGALLVALAAVLVAAPAAGAAPVREGAVGAASPSFAWTGSAYGANAIGEPCGTSHSCEDTLVRVLDAGTLSVGWEAAAPAGPAWLGVSVYASDPAGTEGEVMADGGDVQDSGAVNARLEAGYYLVRVAGLLTTLASYDATATLKPRAVPAIDPAPAPPAEPKKTRKCRKKGKGKKARRAHKRCKRRQAKR